jgi:hypothetical protein
VIAPLITFGILSLCWFYLNSKHFERSPLDKAFCYGWALSAAISLSWGVTQ